MGDTKVTGPTLRLVSEDERIDRPDQNEPDEQGQAMSSVWWWSHRYTGRCESHCPNSATWVQIPLRSVPYGDPVRAPNGRTFIRKRYVLSEKDRYRFFCGIHGRHCYGRNIGLPIPFQGHHVKTRHNDAWMYCYVLPEILGQRYISRFRFPYKDDALKAGHRQLLRLVENALLKYSPGDAPAS